MTQHIQPIPSGFKREMKLKNIDQQKFFEYLASTLEYQHWVLTDDSPSHEVLDYICFMAPVSRTMFLDDFTA